MTTKPVDKPEEIDPALLDGGDISIALGVALDLEIARGKNLRLRMAKAAGIDLSQLDEGDLDQEIDSVMDMLARSLVKEEGVETK